MGAYLSEPLTEKASSDDSNEFVKCGLSSMQGWRMTQEDAHNSLLSFDSDASLFAVYDGHGGHEVAAYCAENLPKFIRETEAYSKGDYIEALKQAFLGFDASLTSPEVISILKELAGKEQSGSEDEDNVTNLREEARMPIEQLLAKYQTDGNPAIRKLQSADGKLPPSPYLKSRKSENSSGAGASCSSSCDGPSASGVGSSAGPSAVSNAGSSAGSSAGCSSSSSSNSDLVSSSSANDESQSCSSNDNNCGDDVPDTQTASPDVGSSGDVKPKEEEKVTIETGTTSDNGGTSTKQNGDIDSTVKKEVNGDISHDIEESDSTSKTDGVSSSSPSKESPVKNGDVSPDGPLRVKGKGKAKDKSPRPDPEAKVDESEAKEPRQTRFSTLQLYKRLLKNHAILPNDDESDETEDEDDTTFEGGDVECSDDDEEGDDDEIDDDEEEEDEDDEEDSMDEDDDDDDEEEEDEFGMKFADEPGADSGCTAVVALLKGRDLYVANAGDSRCVVCRGGKAIDMSLDHKPEDGPEMKRILSAGGKVTCDGRVNGGLNLSRAIGDHAYKQSKELPPTEQMITALPDVRTLRIDPEQDEFMVLACDGIWNFLSSQEVVDFVRLRINEGKLQVSQICEELFDHCLAPNTLGDGTGCDNMTAVIVRFTPALANAPSTLSHDSVFDVPISNDTEDKEAKSEAEAVPEAKSAIEGVSEVVNDEVTTSVSLKRAAPSDAPKEGDCAGSEHQEKRSKTNADDSEAVAVEV